MVFLLTLPSVITICKVSIDGMRIQGRIVEKSKKVGSTFKKKAKWFGYTLWRLAYYLGLNFRNQTNYFDHSYTHCSKGVFFQKGHEIFFLPSFVSFVIIVNITLKPLTNYSEYSFKSAELICFFFQCKVFFLHSDA